MKTKAIVGLVVLLVLASVAVVAGYDYGCDPLLPATESSTDGCETVNKYCDKVLDCRTHSVFPTFLFYWECDFSCKNRVTILDHTWPVNYGPTPSQVCETECKSITRQE